MRKSLILFLTLFLLSSGVSRAQDYLFNHLGRKDGLSGSSVTSIVMDNKGYLWIGTENGLNRYDGYGVRQYNSRDRDDAAIINDRVTSLSIGKSDYLYVGTVCGLSRLDVRTMRVDDYVSTDGENNAYINQNFVNRIVCGNGKVWVATNDGVKSFSDSCCSFFPVDTLMFFRDADSTVSLGEVYDIDIVSDSVRMIGGERGLVLSQADSMYRIYDKAVEAVKVLEGNDVLVSVRNGLRLLSFTEDWKLSQQRYLQYSGKDIKDISFIESDGTALWIGTRGDGLYRCDRDGHIDAFRNSRSISATISNDYVTSYFYDERNDCLLFGTEAGVDWCRKDNVFTTYSTLPFSQVPDNITNVHSIYADGDGFMMIGTKTGGICLMNFKTGRSGKIPVNAARAFLKTSDGNYYVGTQGDGMYEFRIDERTLSFQENAHYLPLEDSGNSLVSRGIYAICEDSSGNLWLAGKDGLGEYRSADRKKRNGVFRNYKNTSKTSMSFPSSDLYALHFNGDYELWIGSLFWGVSKMFIPASPDSGSDVIFSNYSSRIFGAKKTVDVYSIVSDTNGILWLGTNSGLCRYSTLDGTVDNFSSEDGLPDDNVYAVVLDEDGKLWCSTGNGIFSFNPSDASVSTYYEEDGLQSYEFNGGAAFRDKAGCIYFGGKNGVSCFHPSGLSASVSGNGKQVFLSELFVNNEKTEPGDGTAECDISFVEEITLPYFKNTLGVTFSTLEYLRQSQRHYEFMMEGISDGWVSNGNSNTVVFSSLKPGRYNLRIRAVGQNVAYPDSERSLSIRIKPPVFLSWGAYLLYSIILIAVLWFIARLAYQRFRLRYELRAMELDKKRSEEANEAKLQFFTNISHELRTPLSMIVSPVESLVKGGTMRPEDERLLSTVYRNAKKLNLMIEEIILFRKVENSFVKFSPEKNDIVMFVRLIVDSFYEIASKSGISLSFDCPVDSYVLWFDPDKMEKILNNLITNAIKYTRQGGEIEVATGLRGRMFFIDVGDTGIGIPDTELPHIFDRFYQSSISKGGFGIGLNLTRQLVELHKGRISVSSELGKGSLFTVEIPSDVEYERGQLSEYEKIVSSYEVLRPDKGVILPDFMNSDYGKVPVLVVEDNLDLLDYISSSLGKRFRVFKASNGAEAFELARECKPKVIVSDANMPVMDGFELCRKIRDSEMLSSAYFIMLTALEMTEYKIKGVEAGVDVYLSKPFSMDYLEALVAKNINRSKIEYDQVQKVHLSADDEFLERLKSRILENMSMEDFSVEMLADCMAMDRTNLYRKTKKLADLSPLELIRQVRMSKASELLRQGMRAAEVADMVGIPDIQYFSRVFKKYYGKTPTEYVR